MRRYLVRAGLILAVLVPAWASPAAAATPNNQGCLGADFSTYAQNGAGFGGFIESLATNSTSGVGAEVQAHMAGLVPDGVIENSCNNP
jgi:hypothetical protein